MSATTSPAIHSAQSAAAKAREATAADATKLPTLVTALHLLGDALREAGDTAGAEAAYREALTKSDGQEFPVGTLAGVRMNLATLLDFTAREADASPFYEDAITDFEALGDKESIEIAAQLRNNLAMTYKSHGKFALAEQHYLRSLEILEANHGRNSEAVATVYNNLGGLYYVAGFPDQAKEMFNDGLEIRIKVLGNTHRDVAQAYCNLATACHELRDNETAKKHFTTSLLILEPQIAKEARSYQATSLDYIAMLEMIGDESGAEVVKQRLEKMLPAS
jgi:tetratricopeptide (TPR) repeat protein